MAVQMGFAFAGVSQFNPWSGSNNGSALAQNFSQNFGTSGFGNGPVGNDGFRASAGFCEGNGSALGGLGNGLSNPMNGMGCLAQANPQQTKQMMFLVGMLAGMMASQGQRGPGLGSQAGPGAMGGCNPAGGCNQSKTIQLKKGSSFTTPGGAKISWKGDEVKVHEPGGKSQASGAAAEGRSFGGGNSFAMGAFMSGPGFSAGMMVAGSAGMGGAAGACACHCAQKEAKPRNWKVWGDPHIVHPNGSKSDFKKKNAMFTLQDGTRVLMGAANPKGVVKSVQIILPGGEPNWSKIDPKQTSIMQDNGKGHFNDIGTADKMMQGGFGGGQGGNPLAALMGMFA
jgi:hypothetical protein